MFTFHSVLNSYKKRILAETINEECKIIEKETDIAQNIEDENEINRIWEEIKKKREIIETYDKSLSSHNKNIIKEFFLIIFFLVMLMGFFI